MEETWARLLASGKAGKEYPCTIQVWWFKGLEEPDTIQIMTKPASPNYPFGQRINLMYVEHLEDFSEILKRAKEKLKV